MRRVDKNMYLCRETLGKVQLHETMSIENHPQPYSPKARPLQKATSIAEMLKVIAKEENSRSCLSDSIFPLSHAFLHSRVPSWLSLWTKFLINKSKIITEEKAEDLNDVPQKDQV